MEELLELLEDCCPDVDFCTSDRLIDDSLLDSLDIVTIVGELSDRYGIEIGMDELKPENFNSAEAILGMVERLREEE